MHWNDLRYFLALARRGSVRAAGVELGVSHSTVARRVEALEQHLGTRLFDRHHDGVELTAAGARMVPRAECIEAEMCALERSLLGQDERVSGPVHLTCSDTYVARFALDVLRPLCLAQRQLALELDADDRPLNLAKGEAQLAVRVLPSGVQPPEHLVARKVAPLHLACYRSRAHISSLTNGSPGLCWLAYDDVTTMKGLVAASPYPDLPTWGAFSSLGVMVAAALEGYGLAMLPTYVGDAEGGLERLPAAETRHLADLWLLYHPDLRDMARVRAVREVLHEAFSKHRARFDGSP